MAYKLTLTLPERQAISWVGNRYSCGNELYRLLWAESANDRPDADWDDHGPITFDVPESVAWQIKENADGEDGFWPCFAHELAHKMQAFCDSIT